MRKVQQHKKTVSQRRGAGRSLAMQASIDRARFVLVGVALVSFALASLSLSGCSGELGLSSDSDALSDALTPIEAPRLSIETASTAASTAGAGDGFLSAGESAWSSDGATSGTPLSPPELSALGVTPLRHHCLGDSGPADRPHASSMLASFSGQSGRAVQLQFGGFEESLSNNRFRDPSTRLIQSPAIPDVPEGFDTDEDMQMGSEDAGVGPSASDLGPVEIVATPVARPEFKAEEIPTPQGIPERVMSRKTPVNPITRIAADVESSKGTGPSKTASGLNAAGLKPMAKKPNVPALIDPTTELGLIGTQQAPDDFRKWQRPDAVLFITGDQHGYLEPCGCTGLDKQKGGVARRFTFMQELRGMGWDLVPIDAGNQIRRIGRQAEIKLGWSADALSKMKYTAVGFGAGDMRVDPINLLSTAMNSSDGSMYVSANVELLQEGMIPTHKVIRQGDWAIGVSTVLDPDALEVPVGDSASIKDMKQSAERVLQKMNSEGATFRVLTFFGKDKSCEDRAKQLMVDVPGYDLVVVAGSGGEPTYQPQAIPNSQTKMIVTGYKGMYAGLIGLYANETMKYARVALTHEFDDAPEMRKLMSDYQTQLEQLGLKNLGLSPIPHFSGEKFVGSKKCGECHTTAYEIWESSAHFDATEHLVKPPRERGDVARHFDPECLSCHVTGWNPQDYLPYESGYLDLASSQHLTGNGCENCHGPGSAHSAAEAEGSDVTDERRKSLRLAMQLPLDRAKEHCMKCHDLDNSPDFHDEDAFEDEYWPQVEHYGTD